MFPSNWENFPNECREAISTGKAIIAGKIGGMYDILNEDHAGILINPLDYKEIASKIKRFLCHPYLIWEYILRARTTLIKKIQ